MKNKVVRKILISIIISIMLINLIYVNFGEVFALPGYLTGNTTNPGGTPYPAGQQDPDQTPNQTPTPDVDEEMDNEKIAKMIKDAVAKWYYIMRLIVIAFMLILLIFIGIKMAISTVASEKAVYKQMMVDWVAGMIIVFSIHYVMVFILTVNDNIVAALEPLVSAKSIVATNESEFGAEEDKKTSSQMETTLYESARTRAYSLKFTDGFVGMLIYGVLVYYAWRYTLMYFRRVINIIILTLVAPAVSASYAFNKVMSGKAKIFSTWLSEYIMNVAVQTVHVIMYVSFVSTALVLSLESLPGVILAIVLLNFMIKADGIVRRIFKLSGGNGSLAGDMTDRSTFKHLKSEVEGMANVMVGGAVTKQAAKLTYRVATKPVRDLAEKKVGNLMETRANDPKYIAAQKKKEENAEKDAEAAYLNYRKTIGLDEKEEKIRTELETIQKKLQKTKNKTKIATMMQQVEENERKQEELEQEEQQAQDEFLKYYHSSGTTKETIKDGVAQIFSPESYTREITKSDLKRYRELEALNKKDFKEQYKKGEITRAEKEMFEEFQRLEKKLGRRLRAREKVGDEERPGDRIRIRTRRSNDEEDAPWRRLMGQKSDSIGKRFVKNMKLKSILGLSDDEEKVLKDMEKFYKQSIMGVISGIAGWATIGSNFMLGMGLLATSAAAKGEIRKRRAASYNRPNYKMQGTYRFKAFSKGTEETIYEEAMRQIKFAENEMTKRNAERHPGLAHKIMNTTKVVVKPIFVAGVTVSGVCLGVNLQTKSVPKANAYGTRLRPSLTFLEDDKLAALHDKKLRDDFKDMKKRFARLNCQSLQEDFDEKFAAYQKECAEQAEAKGKNSLLVQEASARENTIVVSDGANKFVVQIKDDSEINKLAERADKTDNISNLTRREKLTIIKSDIAKNETALIEDSIVRVCAQKGISDVANLDLTDADNIQIKKEILGSLEKRGIIQKGEIVLDDDLISSEKIATVHENLVKDESKCEQANGQVSEKIVQEAVLEYMAKKGILDKKMLQNSSAKGEIYDIIKERLMSDESKSSGDVIAKISGTNKLKEQTELPDEIKMLVDETSSKVQKYSLLKPSQEDTEKSEEVLKKLVERETTRKVNETKEKLEKGLYTDGKNIDDEKQLEMLFTLVELGRQNKEAEKAGDKSARKERKKQTAAELEYYLQKDGSKKFNSRRDGSRRVDTSKDGSRRVDEKNDGNKDVSKIIKDLETRLHGPHDVINLLNKPIRSKKK